MLTKVALIRRDGAFLRRTQGRELLIGFQKEETVGNQETGPAYLLLEPFEIDRHCDIRIVSQFKPLYKPLYVNLIHLKQIPLLHHFSEERTHKSFRPKMRRGLPPLETKMNVSEIRSDLPLLEQCPVVHFDIQMLYFPCSHTYLGSCRKNQKLSSSFIMFHFAA